MAKMKIVEDPIAATIRAELAEEQKKLEKLDAERQPILERIELLQRMMRELNLGPLKSGSVSDAEIVKWVRDNTSEDERAYTSDVAAAFGGDGRGYARRLKRMSEETPPLLSGNPHDGYYVDGFDHGEETTPSRSRAKAMR